MLHTKPPVNLRQFVFLSTNLDSLELSGTGKAQMGSNSHISFKFTRRSEKILRKILLFI